MSNADGNAPRPSPVLFPLVSQDAHPRIPGTSVLFKSRRKLPSRLGLPLLFRLAFASPEAVRLLREHGCDARPLDGGFLSWRRGTDPWRATRKTQTFPADRTSNAPWSH
ncbi:hypothetical protein [Nonomuraea bangladeshensis]|uniref:hypothetical protein n=1 Tax=Nonomuraea bangladeshensis TaxID=404385 RepID=UPI003C2FFF7E